MRSTLTQLLSHWDSILDGLESGEGVDAVYLDFSKAFDKVETGAWQSWSPAVSIL